MVSQHQTRPALESERDRRILFFQSFLKRPGMVGSVIPSSRYLERRIVKEAGLASARVAVELGPGVGGTTRAILRALPADAKLLSIEINPDFVPALRAIGDPAPHRPRGERPRALGRSSRATASRRRTSCSRASRSRR